MFWFHQLYNEQKSVAAEGFRDGTQEIKPEAALEQLLARCAQQQAEVRYAAARKENRWEARIELLSRRLPELEAHWRAVKAETAGRILPIVLPLLAVPASFLAIGGEAILLAPVMDGFGITQPFWQFFAAVVLILVASGLLKSALHQLRSCSVAEPEQETPRARNWSKIGLTGALTLLVCAFVFVLGWFRAEQMIFAGRRQGGALGEFLAHNPNLTLACVTLLTIGLPVFTAVACEWGLDRLRLAWERHKTCLDFWRSTWQLQFARKRLNSVITRCHYRVTVLAERQKELAAIYWQNYELGQVIGARQQPWWQVFCLILAVPLLILAAWLLVEQILPVHAFSGLLRGMFYAFSALGLSGLHAYRLLKAWERPTARQLYRQRATLWRGTTQSPALRPSDFPPVIAPALPPRPLTAERKAASYSH
jgi:hypothetical protein